MNTAAKIVATEALAALDPPRPLLLVTGAFDILQPGLVRDLAEARERTGARTLAALVTRLAGAHIPLEGRRQLAAGLRVIDYVLTAEIEHLDSLSASLQPIEIIRLEEADRRRAQQLIEHVRRRQLR